MIKILYIVPTIDPQYGGPVNVVNAYINLLKQRGYEIILFPRSSKSKTIYLLPFLKRFKLTYFPGIKELMKLRDLIKSVDIIHIHGLWSAPTSFGSFFARKYHKPYIITLHGMLDEWCLNQNSIGKKIYSTLLEKKNLNKASAIHCLHEKEVENLKKLGLTTPAFVLPNGVNFKDFNFLPNKEKLVKLIPQINNKIVVLFLGRIHPKKGFDILIPAFANALSRVPNLYLIIAGPDEGGYIEKVQNLIEEYSLQNSVTFMGFVSGESKKALLMGSDIFILPSYQEGDSVAIKEAMASRLPVIITPGCNFPEVEKNNAGIVVEPEVESITNAIINLANNKELREEMGKNGHNLIKNNYDWTQIVNKLVVIYEDILNNRFTSPCWRR